MLAHHLLKGMCQAALAVDAYALALQTHQLQQVQVVPVQVWRVQTARA